MTIPEGSRTVMPGGGVARRPLHFIIMADCSGGMAGEKMQALNYAIAAKLPHLVEWEREQLQAQVMVRVLAFATEPAWHVPDAVPVSELRWKPLHAVEHGWTNMGPAFRKVAEVLAPDKIESRALRPAILLVTDGLPTDKPGEFEAGLEALLSLPAGRSSLRMAIAIGRGAESEFLDRFIGDVNVPVLFADNTDEIADRLVAASIAVSRMCEGGGVRESLAVLLRRREGGPGPDRRDEETIV